MSKIAGIFILGVLAGWLIEWIFVRLFVSSPKKKFEADLQAARKENEVLQQQVNELQTSLTAAKEAAAAAAKPVEPAPMPAPVAVEKAPEPVMEAEEAEDVAEAAPAEPEVQDEPKSEPVAESAPTIEVVDGEDDLTKLNGIGPKLAEAMKTVGIKRFGQIANMEAGELGERLSSSGIRYSKVVAESWPAQAKLAEAGDWDGLKSFQAAMKA